MYRGRDLSPSAQALFADIMARRETGRPETLAGQRFSRFARFEKTVSAIRPNPCL